MFELEDFDLDDEVFLNTQIPILADESQKSNLNCVTYNIGKNDETFLNTSKSVFEADPFHSQNINFENKSIKEQNKNISILRNNITNGMSMTEHKSKPTKPDNECILDKNKLVFDESFDSDDEIFFQTSNIILEDINSSKSDNFTGFNSTNDHNESLSSFTSKRHKSMFNSSNVESTNRMNYNSHMNTTVTSVKTITPLCSTRKFPGPAGLLSENEDLLYSEDPSHLESLDISINIAETDKADENLCGQANDLFSSSPYQQFLSDFFATDVDILLDKYNVAWIKQKLLPYIASGRFFTDKIPFFVSIIKEIDCLSPDPTVVLADRTGHITGTIHRAVWNQFSKQLKLGAVLVLSKVGVSCQKIVKGFTLNITSDHLIAIYSFSSEDIREVTVSRTTHLTNEEIIDDAKQWRLLNVDTISDTKIKSGTNALDNLKMTNTLLSDQNSQLSNTSHQTINNTSSTTRTFVKSFFRPKTPVAHKLLQTNTRNSSEEPPVKRIRNEEEYSNNDQSIIRNIFEGIDEDELFNDFFES